MGIEERVDGVGKGPGVELEGGGDDGGSGGCFGTGFEDCCRAVGRLEDGGGGVELGHWAGRGLEGMEWGRAGRNISRSR